jgi:ribosomal protein L11 methyltransferase
VTEAASSASWLRIALEVDPEIAEAVSEVLARYIPGGIVIESTAVTANDEDEGGAIGPMRVLGYIPSDDQLEHTRAQIEQGLRMLAMIQPLPEPAYEIIHKQNWMEAWKQHYKPLIIGERMMVVPAWMDVDTGGRIPIRIEPGMAFGTGVHPTTQLSLQLVEEYVRPGLSVFDIGSGSAILAIAATKLGAARVVALDNDPEALSNAQENARLNDTEIAVGVGSVADVLAGNYGAKQADVVVANILAPVLIRLLGDGLGELVAPDGVLLLSGILAEQEAAMKEALHSKGFKVIEERRIDDWLGLAVKAD